MKTNALTGSGRSPWRRRLRLFSRSPAPCAASSPRPAHGAAPDARSSSTAPGPRRHRRRPGGSTGAATHSRSPTQSRPLAGTSPTFSTAQRRGPGTWPDTCVAVPSEHPPRGSRPSRGCPPNRVNSRFGSVRQLRSGRWQARFPGPDGLMRPADRTFETQTDAEVWLSVIEADIVRGNWFDPDAGRVPLGDCAKRWIAERPGLSPRTVTLYDGLVRLHIA